ncbi:RtcB family protein [Desulfohalovibrio reitneri]|uniref:RtcB family protein n=1 Tax=Desulfohalovibrio reitneri TaxID=1307759 RepID=UPI0004A77D7E|nr:RtcB family protein [Desulfohalovibrio reitneri]
MSALARLERLNDFAWLLPRTGGMRVEGVVHMAPELVRHLDDITLDQLAAAASLPGVVGRVHAMPDAHQGFGFPIGGVAAFHPKTGLVSAGAVGFDIACGVRTFLLDCPASAVRPKLDSVADALFRNIPSGTGSSSRGLDLNEDETLDMLLGGAVWAVNAGYGEPADLERIEHGGRLPGADPTTVSTSALRRLQGQLGSLGSGNHYLEVQEVESPGDSETASGFDLRRGMTAVSIHCGSRGFGHQIASDSMARMEAEASRHGLASYGKNLAAAPLGSPAANDYLAAMASAANFALANRQVICARARNILADLLPVSRMPLLFDVSHNLCLWENHELGGSPRSLLVHRKGATRALPPGHPDLPSSLRTWGQPVPVGGSMGTGSYILAGMLGNPAFHSACHGAGRSLSRSQAKKRYKGKKLLGELKSLGVVVRSGSMSGLAEEAPEAYKDVDAVARSSEGGGLARVVARLRPLACIKG